MGGIENAIYDNLSKKGWKTQSFLISGTFTAPIDGLYFISGSGGGSGGADTLTGGAGGAACDMVSLFLNKGTSITVTIGAGGAVPSGAGGTTSFGSLIVLPGAVGTVGGLKKQTITHAVSGGTYIENTTTLNSESIGGGFIAGASLRESIIGNSRFKGNEGAGGFYGEGGKAATPAAANSGAGGAINGPGGSGRLDVMWQE